MVVFYSKTIETHLDAKYTHRFGSTWKALELLVDPKLKERTIGLATGWLICIKLLELWLPISSVALMLHVHPLDIAILH